MGSEAEGELFARVGGGKRRGYKGFAFTVFLGIFMIWVYRLSNVPSKEEGRWVWIGMLMAELWFGFYWVITQSVRWDLTLHLPFKQTLFHRYGENLPCVDVFVCTADPTMEPPALVVNTVLSAMAYDYPPEKLSIYLSDDGCSELTFYALWEASFFCKKWLPFCRKFMVEPRSPEAYFAKYSGELQVSHQWLLIKKTYEEMKNRIESAVETGKIPKEMRDKHKGFSEWTKNITKQDHHSIVQIVIDGNSESFLDEDGLQLPKLVYMAREKRPGHPHNFKAGAMNALIRISFEISNAPFILNIDCDMYANDPETIREIMCFFMDEKKGDEIAFVQFPQKYKNLTKNDIYGNEPLVVDNIELASLGGYGAALYCGTGCFHRRESLWGRKYGSEFGREDHIKIEAIGDDIRSVIELEEASKILVDCNYEKNTLWGKEMGLVYGCPVEDIVTGLAVQCRGWKSIYYNPKRMAFMGLAPTALDTSLVQFKRWSEGLFQIFFSKYCPFIYGHKKIKFLAQMGYCVYLLWAPLSLPTLFYVVFPPLCLLHNISLFPQVTSRWFIPFAYVFLARNFYSLAETLSCGKNVKAWWNLQRMLLFRRTSAFLFAFIDTILRQLGLSETKFAVTTKVANEEARKRYEEEIIEFGSSNSMFIIISAVAELNFLALVLVIKKVAMDMDFQALNKMILQILLSGLLVLINFPIYQALLIRTDKGKMPISVGLKSLVLVFVACLIPIY